MGPLQRRWKSGPIESFDSDIKRSAHAVMVDLKDDGISLLRRLSKMYQKATRKTGDDNLDDVNAMYVNELREMEKLSCGMNRSVDEDTLFAVEYADRSQQLVTIDELDDVYLELVALDSLLALPICQRRYRDTLLSIFVVTFARGVLCSHENARSKVEQIHSKLLQWFFDRKHCSPNRILEIMRGLLTLYPSEIQCSVTDSHLVRKCCLKTLLTILQHTKSSINSDEASISRLDIDKIDVQLFTETAVDCLALLILGPKGEVNDHWISQLNSESIFFLLEWNENTRSMEAEHCQNTHLNRLREREELLIEMLMPCLYCEALVPDQRNSTKSSINEKVAWYTLLDAGVIEHRDLLLRTFYYSESLIVRSMIWLLFSDSAFASYCTSELEHSTKTDVQEALERYEVTASVLIAGSLPEHLSAFPMMFLNHAQTCKSPYTTYIRNQADPKTLQSETVFQSYFSNLCEKLKIFEYFARSKRIQDTIDTQSLGSNSRGCQENANESIMQEVETCLQSKHLCDTFRGEKLLAELLMYEDTSNIKLHPSDPMNVSLVKMSAGHDELEDTFCFDSEAALVVAARSFFWQLGRSKRVSDRVKFCRVLQLYLKRKFFSMVLGLTLIGTGILTVLLLGR